MKFYLGCLALVLLICSCQTKSAEDTLSKSTSTQHIVLFLDKSASFGLDTAFITQKYQEQIRLLLQSHIQKAGDRIEVFYVHDNTLKGKCLDLVAKTPQVDTQTLNPTDVESAQLDFDLQIGKERLKFEKKILEVLHLPNSDLSNQMTDLGATLSLLNERNTGDVSLTSYYFSDMLESTRNGLNFHKKKPTTPEEAKSWATGEAEKYKDINLQGVAIIMILPFNPMTNSKKNDPYITLFWTTLFENLGALSVEEL